MNGADASDAPGGLAISTFSLVHHGAALAVVASVTTSVRKGTGTPSGLGANLERVQDDFAGAACGIETHPAEGLARNREVSDVAARRQA